MLLLSVFLLFLAATDAMMFPKVCIEPGNNDFPVPCCPPFNGTPCGSGSNRGSCMSLSLSRSVPPPDLHLDDRYLFPAFFFSTICQCKENFAGINCGECDHNRYGENCEFKRDLVREEIRQKSETEQKQYMVWLNFCKKQIDPDYYILRAGDRIRTSTFEFIEASYYDVWCYSNYYTTKPFINNTRESFSIHFGHGSTGFLSQLRKSLLFMESQMQKCTKNPFFTLAYYDWQSDEDCAICNNDFVGANDDQGYLHSHNIFSNWKMSCAEFDYPTTYCLMSDTICERPKIRRQPGAAVGFGKATGDDVETCLSLPDVDTVPYNFDSVGSYRNCIEGYIDALMNIYFGGTMSESPIACNDPLYLFHQTFLDKIFEKYLRRWQLTKLSYPDDNDIYGHGAYDCITPFCQCTRNRDMFVDSSFFSFTYSIFNNF